MNQTRPAGPDFGLDEDILDLEHVLNRQGTRLVWERRPTNWISPEHIGSIAHDHEDGSDPVATHGVRHSRKPRADGLVFRSHKCYTANKQRNPLEATECPGLGPSSNGKNRTSVIADRVEALVLYELARFLTNEERLNAYGEQAIETLNAQAPDGDVAELEHQEAELAARKERVDSMFEWGKLDQNSYLSKLNAIEDEEEELEALRERLNVHSMRVRTVEDLLTLDIETERDPELMAELTVSPIGSEDWTEEVARAVRPVLETDRWGVPAKPLAPWAVEDLKVLANALDIHVYISRADGLPSYAPEGDALGNWPTLRVEFDGGTLIEVGGDKAEEGRQTDTPAISTTRPSRRGRFGRLGSSPLIQNNVQDRCDGNRSGVPTHGLR